MDLIDEQYTPEVLDAALFALSRDEFDSDNDPDDDDDDEAFDDELADRNDLHEIQTGNDSTKPNPEDDDHLPDDD